MDSLPSSPLIIDYTDPDYVQLGLTLLVGFMLGVIFILSQRSRNGFVDVFASWWTLNISRRNEVHTIRGWSELLGFPLEIISSTDSTFLVGSTVAAVSSLLMRNRTTRALLPT